MKPVSSVVDPMEILLKLFQIAGNSISYGYACVESNIHVYMYIMNCCRPHGSTSHLFFSVKKFTGNSINFLGCGYACLESNV